MHDNDDVTWLVIMFLFLVIEFLPAELKSRFSQIKELDERVQGILVSLYPQL